MNEKQLAISKLQSIVDQANQASSFELFFILLYEFAKLLLLDSLFKREIKAMIDRGMKAKAPLKVLEKEAFRELRNKCIKISRYLKKNNVSDQLILEELIAFQNQLQVSNQLDQIFIYPLEIILWKLLNDGSVDHSDFVGSFGKIYCINDDKNIRTEDAFPKFKAWERESFYLAQKKKIADWHSLDQIIAFFERYDLQCFDNIIAELEKQGVDTSKLYEEHNKLMSYAYFGKAASSNLFPTIEEYKDYMRRVLEAIKEMVVSEDTYSEVRTCECDYNFPTGELKIGSDEPVVYKTNENPAKLLKIMKQRRWKPLTFTAAYNGLGLNDGDKVKDLGGREVKQIRGIIRQVNERVTMTGRSQLLIHQKHKHSLKEKEIILSSLYRPV